MITDPPYGLTALKWDEALDLKLFWEMAWSVSNYQIIFSQQPFTTDLIVSNRENYRFDMVWDKKRVTGFLNVRRRPLRAHENVVCFGELNYNPVLKARKSSVKHVARSAGVSCYRSDKGSAATIYKYMQPTSILRYSVRNSERGLHPTRKPLKLLMWIIETFSEPNDLIIDPYSGSGTTLLAAKAMGRRAIGIERSMQYCEIAIKQLRNQERVTHLEQMPLFAPRHS
jgi:hypothetical protein